MKKSIRVSKKAYFLAIILALLAISTCLVFSKAIVNEDPFDINQFKENIQASPDEWWKKPAENRENTIYDKSTELQQFTFDIDQFKENVQASPEECWKKPAENRKNIICNKLTELQQLITEEQFEEAYDKLLHDIKPKLTGLKQNEHEEQWGNGVYKKPWVICSDLQAIYSEDCDSILSQINPSILPPPLDSSPPVISIDYNGEHYTDNPGELIVSINDPQSGLDEVQITIYDADGNIEDSINDQNLNGIESKSYNVLMPSIEGIHTIVVTATNFDHFSQIETELEELIPPPDDPGDIPVVIG